MRNLTCTAIFGISHLCSCNNKDSQNQMKNARDPTLKLLIYCDLRPLYLARNSDLHVDYSFELISCPGVKFSSLHFPQPHFKTSFKSVLTKTANKKLSHMPQYNFSLK